MSAFVWEGLPELLEQLRNLPKAYAEEATEIVRNTAEAAKAEAALLYPNPRPNDRDAYSLKNGMKVQEIEAGVFGVGYRVVHTAFYALMYENGTVARKSRFGNRGAIKEGKHVFIPVMIRRRSAMYDQLRAMVERSGVEVSYSNVGSRFQ